MHCGHLQFQHGSWHNRNYIKLDGKRHRLTVPVHRPHIKPIREVWFEDGGSWKTKHLETIARAYGDAPFFDDYYPALKEIIYRNPHSLEMLNICLTDQMAFWLGIETRIVDSIRLHLGNGIAVDKIIQMCQAMKADRYLSNCGARDYLFPEEEKRLEDAGICHSWLDWMDPDEEPFSAIHHLFTLGPKAAELLK